jgi:hypothetical protein
MLVCCSHVVGLVAETDEGERDEGIAGSFEELVVELDPVQAQRV